VVHPSAVSVAWRRLAAVLPVEHGDSAALRDGGRRLDPATQQVAAADRHRLHVAVLDGVVGTDASGVLALARRGVGGGPRVGQHALAVGPERRRELVVVSVARQMGRPGTAAVDEESVVAVAEPVVARRGQ